MEPRLPTSLHPALLSNQWHQRPVPHPISLPLLDPSHLPRPPNQLNPTRKDLQLQQRQVLVQVKVHQVSQDSSISSFPSSISIPIFNLFLQIFQISSFLFYLLHPQINDLSKRRGYIGVKNRIKLLGNPPHHLMANLSIRLSRPILELPILPHRPMGHLRSIPPIRSYQHQQLRHPSQLQVRLLSAIPLHQLAVRANRPMPRLGVLHQCGRNHQPISDLRR
jgi:hypothetical protein